MSHRCEHGLDSDICSLCFEERTEPNERERMNTQQAKHTPGRAHRGALNLTDRFFVAIQDDANPEHTTLLCEVPPYIGNEANAARLAHCWNNHDALLEALQRSFVALEKSVHFQSDLPFWRKGGDGYAAMQDARAAIQAATS